MSAFIAAVQDLVAADLGTQQQASTAFQTAVALIDSAGKDEINWATMQLIERLVRGQLRYAGLVACLVERCLAAGADTWKATGPIIELLVNQLLAADRFEQTSVQRLQAVGLNPEDETAIPIWQELIDADPTGAEAWHELDLWCLASGGLLNTFAEARGLFYRLGGSQELLARLAKQRQGPGELLQVLQRHAAIPSNEPLTAINAALDRLAAGEEIPTVGSALFQALFAVERAAIDHTLQRLAEMIQVADQGTLGVLANIAGSLVELGADPLRVGPALLQRLLDVLPVAGNFLQACLQAAQAQGVDIEAEDPRQIVEAFATSVGPWVEGAAAFDSLDGLILSTIAHLSRSADLRRLAHTTPGLLEAAANLHPKLDLAHWLVQMLHVLDEEPLIVLAPQQRLGWQVQISGVGDNFQLHTLLLGTLIGPQEQGLYPGEVEPTVTGEPAAPGRPFHPRIVGIAGQLPSSDQEPTITSYVQLYNWPALRADGSLPSDSLSVSQWFIWNEGIPADILPFEGMRVVLLGPAPYSRSWRAGRLFPGMYGELLLLQTLPQPMVESWLQQLASAARPTTS